MTGCSTGDRVLLVHGGSPERAREALAAGRAWTPSSVHSSSRSLRQPGTPPQSADYSPPVQAQSPAQSYGVPGGVFAPDGGYGGYSTDSGADYGAPQAPQTPQVQAQPYVEEPPQPQMVTPTQPQPQGFRLQPLPAVTETQPDQGVVQHSDGVPRRGWVLPVVAVGVLVVGLVGGALGGHWLWPGKESAAHAPSAAALPPRRRRRCALVAVPSYAPRTAPESRAGAPMRRPTPEGRASRRLRFRGSRRSRSPR